MFKRIALLVLTNFAVMAAITVVINVLNALGVFGHGDFMRNYGPLVVLSGIAGFGGSFISLLASKWIAKWTTGARVITQPRTSDEAWLLQTVQQLAERAGVATPEVAIYDSPELNAFATGATRNSSLVAVSSGLLTRMSRSEVEAVLGHELSHVANGDMVTLTLLQGVLNTFVIFFSHVIGRLIDGALRGERDDERRGGGHRSVLRHHAGAVRARLFGHADHQRLQPLARISCRPRRGEPGRARQDDRGAAPPGRRASRPHCPTTWPRSASTAAAWSACCARTLRSSSAFKRCKRRGYGASVSASA